MKLFIGSSSSSEIPEKYLKDCKEYLQKVLKEHDLIFGTYKEGIMALCYEITKENHHKVTGICPEKYKDDFNELECDEEVLVKSVLDRTKKLIEISDAIILLPGGIGTITEIISAIDSKRNHEFEKPIIIYNSCNFYDELLVFLDKIYEERFSPENVREHYHISDSAEDTLDYLHQYDDNPTYKKRK